MKTEEKPMITAENLSFTYQGTDAPALRNVNFSVKKGECVLLCGRSGCGKTTLTRLLNGLAPEFYKGKTEGSCQVAGLPCGRTPVEAYVPLVGSVFQNPKTQYFNTNTTAELAFPCENVGMEPGQIRERVEQCAKDYGLEPLMGRSIFRLSGGEKQRIACAAATMLHPGLLVFDEPTSNLDSRAIDELREMILHMKKEGITIVLAEHRLAWARDFADTCLYFEDGEMKERYAAADFFALPDEELARRGLRAADLSAYRSDLEKKTIAKIAADDKKSAQLVLENVTVGYEKKKPVLHVEQMELAGGEIVGLMGRNGIGKSTLTRTICGLVKPLGGKICRDGKQMSERELRKMSFLVMQDVNYQLFSDSVREEVLLDTEDEARCEQVLEKLGLLPFAERHPMSLSGGQKQRTAIASAMVSEKELILLDEPTSGLDRHHMRQVGSLLTMLKKQGKMILVITHDEELAAGWCDRIYRLDR